MTDWSNGEFPSLRDLGKFAEFMMPDGEMVSGQLDIWPGPDECSPIFIARANGLPAFLADAFMWRYIPTDELYRTRVVALLNGMSPNQRQSFIEELREETVFCWDCFCDTGGYCCHCKNDE